MLHKLLSLLAPLTLYLYLHQTRGEHSGCFAQVEQNFDDFNAAAEIVEGFSVGYIINGTPESEF